MDGRNSESENVELPTIGEEEKKVVSGDMNIEMNLDAIKEVKKQYKKMKRYMRSSIYTVAMMDGREQIVSRLLKDQEDNPT
jgi:predicted amino acid racemase